MNVGSLFSGIGGLDLGLHRAGWNHVFFCESDPWRRDVLRARFPGVPIYEDVRLIGRGMVGRGQEGDDALAERLEGRHDVDLICGGFPCQDLSVAGRRAGLAGKRSGLFYEFARIADTLRPRLLLVENVPGLLSSNGGRDFGVVLGTLADIGYGLAWRILDSRYFGVPQRRRRVFIVGVHAHGDPASAAGRAGEILAVGQGCDRHSAKGGEAGPDAPYASLSGLGSGSPDDNDGQGGRLIAGTLKGQRGKGGGGIGPEETLIADTVRSHPRPGSNSDGLMVVAATLKSQQGRGWSHDAEATYVAAPLSHGSNPNSNMAGKRREDDFNLVAGPLGGGNDGIGRRSEDDPNLVAIPISADALRGEGVNKTAGPDASGVVRLRDPGLGVGTEGDPAFTLSATHPGAVAAHGVRRLTPVECERLQALPDGWTEVPKGAPDSRRYAALGDAVTASVAEWIGTRLLNARLTDSAPRAASSLRDGARPSGETDGSRGAENTGLLKARAQSSEDASPTEEREPSAP